MKSWLFLLLLPIVAAAQTSLPQAISDPVLSENLEYLDEQIRVGALNFTNRTDSTGTVAGNLVGWASSTTAALFATPTATAVPNDDTQPQISEGFRILVATFTALSTANTLIFQWSATVCEPTDSCTFGVACVYQDGTADPLCCKGYDLAGPTAARLEWAGVCSIAVTALPSANTSSHYYTLRIGDNAGSCISFNGCAARFYGGALQTTFLVKEYAP